jgi:hypothetical protein
MSKRLSVPNDEGSRTIWADSLIFGRVLLRLAEQQESERADLQAGRSVIVMRYQS